MFCLLIVKGSSVTDKTKWKVEFLADASVIIDID